MSHKSWCVANVDPHLHPLNYSIKKLKHYSVDKREVFEILSSMIVWTMYAILKVR